MFAIRSLILALYVLGFPSALYSPIFDIALQTLLYAVYYLLSALYSALFTCDCLLGAHHYILFTVYHLLDALYFALFALHSGLWTLYTLHVYC